MALEIHLEQVEARIRSQIELEINKKYQDQIS
jgi:hypothetical protein